MKGYRAKRYLQPLVLCGLAVFAQSCTMPKWLIVVSRLPVPVKLFPANWLPGPEGAAIYEIKANSTVAIADASANDDLAVIMPEGARVLLSPTNLQIAASHVDHTAVDVLELRSMQGYATLLQLLRVSNSKVAK